jgi:hypothetical protein
MEITGVTYSSAHYEAYMNDNNSNIFEEIVESMILDEVSGMNESFKRAISNLSKREKRMAILSLLDKDRNLFKNIKAQITDNKISKVEHLKDVIYKIREYVKVGEVEQKKYGEVMSPLDTVVKPMINEIEDEFWTNPNNKILDNCNGTGPFPLLVIWKLMNGLKEWEPDEDKRYKHIVENMIYVAELQPKNMFIWMCVVDPYDEYKLNLYTGSFLEDGFDRHMKEVWNIPNNRFQLILGNPPYQKSDGGGGKGSSAVPIYNLFTEKSLKITERLLYITPSRWFVTGKGLDSFRKIMINNDNLKLIRHFPGNGSDLFGPTVEIKGGVSYFLIDNKNHDKLLINNKKIDKSLLKITEIILEDTNHYLILDKITKRHNKYFSDIVESRNYFGVNKNGIKTLQNGSNCESIKNDDFSIKCYVSKIEGFIKYSKPSDINKNGLDKFKLLTTKGTNIGKLGNTFIASPYEVCTETYLVILCDSEHQAKNILKYTNTNIFKYLFKLINTTQNSSKSTYRFIPLFSFDNEIDDIYIYKYFDFNRNEIDFIENNI